MRNRGLRKTLIFKNIAFKKKEIWDESKELLVKEIKAVIPDLEESYIIKKSKGHTDQKKRNTPTPQLLLQSSMTGNLQKLLKLVLLKPSHIYLYLKCIHQRSLKEGMKQ